METSERFEMMDELINQSELTELDVQEIAEKINKKGRERVEEEIE